MREQPDLTGATLHFVSIGVGANCQRRQSAPKFDDVAIAVVPLIEQREIFNDLVDWSHGCHRLRDESVLAADI